MGMSLLQYFVKTVVWDRFVCDVDFLKSLRVTDDTYTIKGGSTGCWLPGGLDHFTYPDIFWLFGLLFTLWNACSWFRFRHKNLVKFNLQNHLSYVHENIPLWVFTRYDQSRNTIYVSVLWLYFRDVTCKQITPDLLVTNRMQTWCLWKESLIAYDPSTHRNRPLTQCFLLFILLHQRTASSDNLELRTSDQAAVFGALWVRVFEWCPKPQ